MGRLDELDLSLKLGRGEHNRRVETGGRRLVQRRLTCGGLTVGGGLGGPLRRLAVLAALAMGGCSAGDDPPMPAGCLEGEEALASALGAAPEPVRLGDGTAISTCVELASGTAELQNMGVLVVNVAEGLEARARAGDVEAALRLGYLVGAVQRGAERTSGTHLELAFRVSRAAGSLADPPPAILAALKAGIATGRRTG